MSTLTPNRILQKGDQYNDEGTWKPVPKEELGLQIIFSKLKKHELRRPSEASKQGSVTATPLAHNQETAGSTPAPATISQDRGEHPSANADSEQVSLHPVARVQAERAGLPTVISEKAHSSLPNLKDIKLPHETETEKAFAKAKVVGATTDYARIAFPGLSAMSRRPVWTGRNGSFNGYSVDLNRHGNTITIEPVGKRGKGNCLIEFPVAIIPQVIDWLKDQIKTTTKT